MRVAFVVGQFPALSETFVLDQITGLLDRGADVDIYAGDRRPQSALHPDVERYALMERTAYGAPLPARTSVRRARILGLLARAIARSGGSPLRLRRTLHHGRTDANTALPFAGLGRDDHRDYDIIHCHFGPYGLWGMAMRNMGILGGRLVTTFHGYDLSRVVQQEGADVYARLFEEGDYFLPISRYWQTRLIELGCPPSRVAVHRMGVDAGSFTFTPRTPPEHRTIRILTVGRLTEKKGIEYAIRAVSAFARERVAGRAGLTGRPSDGEDRGSGEAARGAVEHVVIGDGPLRPRLEAVIRELGVEDVVRLEGGKPRGAVIDAMRRAHVLLAPSVTAADGNQEGIPVVLMEAMASGLPVISTVHTGIPELVKPEETGLLVEERDVPGTAEALHRLVEDPQAYALMAQRAREKVERDFDVNRLNADLFRTFRALSAP